MKKLKIRDNHVDRAVIISYVEDNFQKLEGYFVFFQEQRHYQLKYAVFEMR